MRSRALRQRGIIILIIIIFGIIILLQPITKPFQTVGLGLTTPLAKLFQSASQLSGDFIGSFIAAQELQRENKELTAKLTTAYSKLASLNEVKTENASLRRQLQLLPQTNQQVVAASVIGHDPTNLLEYILIDKGSSDGVKEGAAVLSDGALVGEASGVTQHSAKVSLISDPHSQINALVQSSRANGIVKGSLGAGVIISQIPQNETVTVGDIVLTSGLGGQIPKGLLIGTIESVQSRPNDIFQSGAIKSPVTLSKLEIVYIVKGSR